ncbi:MAG: hypothetical protein ACK48D_01285, partial [Pseudanabaena sp.]
DYAFSKCEINLSQQSTVDNTPKTFGGLFKGDCWSLWLKQKQIPDKDGQHEVPTFFILDLIFMFLLALLLMISSSWIFGRGEKIL